jgi:hypothetical protein
MTEPTTDKEWADYLSDVLRRLDTLAVRKPNDAPSLQKYVNEASEALAGLIGYLAALENRQGGKHPLVKERGA